MVLFCCCFLETRVLLGCLGWPQNSSVAQEALQFRILLLHLPKCQNYRCVCLHLLRQGFQQALKSVLQSNPKCLTLPRPSVLMTGSPTVCLTPRASIAWWSERWTAPLLLLVICHAM